MRTISKYISFTLMVFAVVACHTNDIDNPDNPDNPNPPQISDNVTFTASIKQTRVEYTPNGDKLDQRWKKDDVIYGFYDDGDGDGRKIALLVTDVDDKDGYATLKPLPLIGGDEFVAALKECKNGEQLSFGLIYTGKTGSTDTTVEELYYNDEIHVYMSNQSTGQIPACMESTSYEIDESNNGDTIINFEFENRCAILEIKGITGFKESTDLSEDGPTELDNINVSNVINVITYSFHDGAASLGTDGTYKETGVKVSGSIYVDSNGNIVDSNGNSKSVMMAVAPNEKKEDIIVSAETSGGKTFVSSYNTDLVEGTCYVIRQKDVVAKTEDGLYFTTVKAAFDHAADLSSQGYTTAEDNVVTLIKKEIDGFGGVSEIEIDYPVTLDLNGCTLSLSRVEEYFRVVNYPFASLSGALTIIDSTGPDDYGNYEGTIDSESSNPIIHNLSTVIIDGGNLFYTFSQESNYSMIENEGGSLTINNDSYLEAGGSIPKDGEKYYLIHNLGELEVNGGNLYSFDDDIITICNDDGSGTVTINGGKVYSEYVSAIESVGGEVVITGGVIKNESLLKETIQVLGGTECTISGGVIYSLGQQACTIGCRSEDGDNPELTILPKASSYEPVIYSAGVYSTTFPISAYMSGVNNAKIIIKGGCLISNSTYNAFYSDDEGKNLILGKTDTDFNFGGFYSNVPCVITNGQTIDAGTTLLDLNVEGGVVLPNDASSQHYGAILQTDDDLISAIEEILEEGTGEEVSISNIYLIHAVTSISE